MHQEQLDRIARLLNRISDRSERNEIAREIGKVLQEAGGDFDGKRFEHLAGVTVEGTG